MFVHLCRTGTISGIIGTKVRGHWGTLLLLSDLGWCTDGVGDPLGLDLNHLSLKW